MILEIGKMTRIYNNKNVFEDMQWSTVVDVENKLIVYYAYISTEYTVDSKRKDPEGVPLVFLGQSRITRTRKMTDEEYVGYVKQTGMKFDIDARITTWLEDKEKKSKDKKKEMT